MLIGFCGSETRKPWNSSKAGTRISTFFHSVPGQLKGTKTPILKETWLKERRKEQKKRERKGREEEKREEKQGQQKFV